MAINEVILELSRQITVLKQRYDSLMMENQQLIGVQKKRTRKKKTVNVHPALNKWMSSLAVKKEEELLKKHADRISEIRKESPGWEPPNEFFEI